MKVLDCIDIYEELMGTVGNNGVIVVKGLINHHINFNLAYKLSRLTKHLEPIYEKFMKDRNILLQSNDVAIAIEKIQPLLDENVDINIEDFQFSMEDFKINGSFINLENKINKFLMIFLPNEKTTRIP